MPTRAVEFRFLTGLKRSIFHNARLAGSWDRAGRYSDQWTESSMIERLGDDGCPGFTATIRLDLADCGRTFKWGVRAGRSSRARLLGHSHRGAGHQLERAAPLVPIEKCRAAGRALLLHLLPTSWRQQAGQRRRAAGPACASPSGHRMPSRSTWCSVTGGKATSPTMAPASTGPARAIRLTRQDGGIWESAPQPNFVAFEGLPYMYRIKNAQGATVYPDRTSSRACRSDGAASTRAASHCPTRRRAGRLTGR